MLHLPPKRNAVSRETTNRILMIRPAAFGFNPETAASNAFQSDAGDRSAESIQAAALEEFDNMVARLRAAGVTVHVYQDSPEVPKPDAVFPNNWFSTHDTAAVVEYPLLGESRRAERQEGVVDLLKEVYRVGERFDFSHLEEKEIFLEGTGSIIFDRRHRIAYACISPRTHQEAFHEFCHRFNFEPVSFTAEDANGQEIYHTNVMMALGRDFVVICLDSVRRRSERKRLEEIFERTGKEIIDISFEQMNNFAGNMLQVHNADGDPILVMSQAAFDSLRADQIQRLEAKTHLLPVAIPTIEHYGGGSVRCMIAEVYLPKK